MFGPYRLISCGEGKLKLISDEKANDPLINVKEHYMEKYGLEAPISDGIIQTDAPDFEGEITAYFDVYQVVQTYDDLRKVDLIIRLVKYQDMEGSVLIEKL